MCSKLRCRRFIELQESLFDFHRSRDLVPQQSGDKIAVLFTPRRKFADSKIGWVGANTGDATRRI